MEEKENLNSFLQETKYCDFNNKKTKDLASGLTKASLSDKEKAVVLFNWVRDNILYRLGSWQKKASETLKEKEGTCTNKANLLIALLRANGIPAGYGIMKVDGQKYFGAIASPALTKFVGKISTHIYALAYLDGKWIKCDPSNDKELCASTSYFNPTTKLVIWNGRNDAIIDFNKNYIFKETYPVANADSYIGKKAKNARGIPLKVANIYIKFARKNKRVINKPEELEHLFKSYLKKKYPLYYLAFAATSLHKDLQLKFSKKTIIP
jgi:hypothetical protein